MNYGTIGSIYGDKSKEKYNIFLSCDNKFYHRFGINCAKTIMYFAPYLHIHFHIANHSGFRLEHENITYTYEDIELDDTHPTTVRYYASMRLIRAEELFEDWQHVMIIDVDSLAIREIPQDEYIKQSSVLSQLVRKGGRWNNSMICLGLGDKANKFKKSIKEQILKKNVLDYDIWYDQYCIDKIRNQHSISPIELSWLNFKINKQISYFYSGKGERKESTDFENITSKIMGIVNK
jgi:hypothetical protein